MNLVYLAVGSNLGNREKYLKDAQTLLRANPQIQFIRSSKIYETDPIGGPPQNKFLNAVWEIRTDVTPQNLLGFILDIERKLGRERTVKNGPRTIDIDILFYEDLVLSEPNLTIPHPRLEERWFVLKPLWDLAADFVHPVSEKSVCELLDECRAKH